MKILGLTGSIGMGKTTAAGMFRALGIPVYDADAQIHRLYAKGGRAVAPIAAKWPKAVAKGAINRAILSQYVLSDPEALRHLEAITHPLVLQARAQFLDRHMALERELVVLDTPLLFETKSEAQMDYVAVVSASESIQRHRVLARSGMSTAKFESILARQMPDFEKRQRADYILDTSQGRNFLRMQIMKLLADIRAKV